MIYIGPAKNIPDVHYCICQKSGYLISFVSDCYFSCGSMINPNSMCVNNISYEKDFYNITEIIKYIDISEKFARFILEMIHRIQYFNSEFGHEKFEDENGNMIFMQCHECIGRNGEMHEFLSDFLVEHDDR